MVLINNKMKQGKVGNWGKPSRSEQSGMRDDWITEGIRDYPEKQPKYRKSKKKRQEEYLFEIGDTFSDSRAMEYTFNYIPPRIFMIDDEGNSNYNRFELANEILLHLPKEGEKYHEYLKPEWKEETRRITGGDFFDSKYLKHFSFQGEYILRIIDRYRTKAGKAYYDVEVVDFVEKITFRHKQTALKELQEEVMKQTLVDNDRKLGYEKYRELIVGFVVKKLSPDHHY